MRLEATGRAALLLALLPALALAACSGGPGGGGGMRGNRRPPPMRLYAQPSNVIAAEIALARAARETGQWTALAARAQPGAQIAWNGPAAPAATWLASRPAPAAPDRWQAREAWTSCDGSAVVIAGVGHDAAGNWSRYTRVWERAGREFRWAVTVWQPDAELTAARRAEEAQRSADAEDDAITVEALNAIRARTAPCPRDRPPPTLDENAGNPLTPGLARDNTLRWTADLADPTAFTAWWQGAQGWEQVHVQRIAPGG
jgi:hypothetical protein